MKSSKGNSSTRKKKTKIEVVEEIDLRRTSDPFFAIMVHDSGGADGWVASIVAKHDLSVIAGPFRTDYMVHQAVNAAKDWMSDNPDKLGLAKAGFYLEKEMLNE